MKEIIAIALIVLSSLTASAQKIELGLNGGITPYRWADHTFKYLQNASGASDLFKKDIGYYSSFRVALNLHGWQFGAAVDKFQVGLTGPFIGAGPDQIIFNNHTPYLFVNKLFRLPKSYFYAGVNGGFNFIKSVFTSGGKTTATGNHTGYNGGVQAGYTLSLVKGISANAEVGARYLHLRYSLFNNNGISKQMIFPVSLGVRYTF